MTKGFFLCIEGADGSGKGTQHQLLIDRLKHASYKLLEVDYPNYSRNSSHLVKRYLNNEFGDATKLDPELASALFAIDRLPDAGVIAKAKQAGKLVIANRFTASNMAHQGAKMKNQADRLALFKWLHQFEHEIMGIPEPDQYFILHLPAVIAQKRVLQKEARNYTKKKLDGHEADLAYQKRAEQTYLDLAKTFPNKFTVIECLEGKHEKTPDEIHEEIWKAVEKRVNR